MTLVGDENQVYKAEIVFKRIETIAVIILVLLTGGALVGVLGEITSTLKPSMDRVIEVTVLLLVATIITPILLKLAKAEVVSGNTVKAVHNVLVPMYVIDIMLGVSLIMLYGG